MLTTLSILSPDQGKLHPTPRTEAEYFASFAPMAARDTTVPRVAVLPRLSVVFGLVPWIARRIGTHHSGQ